MVEHEAGSLETWVRFPVGPLKMKLCQLGNASCFGCCGRDYKSKRKVKESLDENTWEYKQYKDKKEFANRAIYLKESGVCANLIIRNEKVICPLHPGLNNGKDYRDPLCEKDYFCETMKWFMKLDKKIQNKFIKFLKNKNPDWYEYSIKIDNGKFMKEFLENDK